MKEAKWTTRLLYVQAVALTTFALWEVVKKFVWPEDQATDSEPLNRFDRQEIALPAE